MGLPGVWPSISEGFHAPAQNEPICRAANPSTKDMCHWLGYIERQTPAEHFPRLNRLPEPSSKHPPAQFSNPSPVSAVARRKQIGGMFGGCGYAAIPKR